VSLLFGPIVAVPLTMIVVPLGCTSAYKAFLRRSAQDAEAAGDLCGGSDRLLMK